MYKSSNCTLGQKTVVRGGCFFEVGRDWVFPYNPFHLPKGIKPGKYTHCESHILYNCNLYLEY